MNIKQLRSFLVVAQEHQITAAAKLLFTTQPPLSYQMKQLEKEVGCKLFTRSAHGIELTPEGHAFQQYAQKIVSLANTATETVKQISTGAGGTLRLGLISSAAQVIINSSLAPLKQFYPHVKIEIEEGNTFQLVKKVNNGLLDLAIVRSPFNSVGLRHQNLLADQVVAVYDEQTYHLPAKGLTIRDLQGKPLILYRRFEAIFNNSFAHHGIHPFYAVKCDDARTAILWADQGMGIALVPESIAAIYAKSRQKVTNHPSWQSTIQLVWLKDQQLSPLTKRVIKMLGKSKINVAK